MFAQLGTLEDAGVSAEQAFRTLAGGGTGPLPQACRRVAGALANGREIAATGARHGLFEALDARVVAVAASAGSPARAYRRLARRYEDRARRNERIRARLMMPGLVLVLALLAAPLPALIGGAIGPGGYAARTAGVLLALLAGVAVLAAIARWLCRQPAARRAVDKLSLRLPVFGGANERRAVWQLTDALGLLLGAGLAAAEAAPIALRSVSNSVVAEDLAPGLGRLADGGSLGDAFGASRYVGADVAGLVSTGESAGRLPEMLDRVAEQERARLDLFDEEVAAWAPRVLYLLVAGWIASSVAASYSVLR
jgi:general secretion pathway protein F/type IV pilus assembly protein PilC